MIKFGVDYLQFSSLHLLSYITIKTSIITAHTFSVSTLAVIFQTCACNDQGQPEKLQNKNLIWDHYSTKHSTNHSTTTFPFSQVSIQ